MIHSRTAFAVLLLLLPVGCTRNQPDHVNDTSGRSIDSEQKVEEQKTTGKSIEDYTKAIRLDPKDSVAYFRRGRAHSDKKEYDEAIEDFTEAIRLDREYRDAYFARGSVFGVKGDNDKAIEDLTRVIRLAPESPDAYHIRGNIFGQKKEYDKAIEDLTRVIRLVPRPVTDFRAVKRLAVGV